MRVHVGAVAFVHNKLTLAETNVKFQRALFLTLMYEYSLSIISYCVCLFLSICLSMCMSAVCHTLLLALCIFNNNFLMAYSF